MLVIFLDFVMVHIVLLLHKQLGTLIFFLFLAVYFIHPRSLRTLLWAPARVAICTFNFIYISIVAMFVGFCIYGVQYFVCTFGSW